MNRTVVKCAVLAGLAIVAILPTRLCAAPAKMRVGTYNIRCISKSDQGERSWNDRRKDFFAHLRKLDMDVFGLQEVTAGQYKEIEKEFSDYAMVGRFREAKDFTGEAVPVCYRKSRFDLEKSGTFWLSETPDVPGSKSWDTGCTRICTWTLLKDMKTGKTFCFTNAHTDHKSELARKNGMLLIAKRMREFAPEGTPVVFIGDHNCTETSEPAKAISAILKDALHISETPPSGSWRSYAGWKYADSELTITEALKLPPAKREKKGCRIDYIYVSDGIKVKSYSTLNDPRPGTRLYPSDHFPVVADIEL